MPIQPNLSAKPKYTKSKIKIMRIGQLKTELAALNLPVDGGGLGVLRPRLRDALFPPSTVKVSAFQPTSNPLSVSQPGAPGSANYDYASQPILSPDQVVGGNNIQAKGSEQWLLLTQTSGPVYTRIPVASRNKASQVYSMLKNKLIKANKNDDDVHRK